MSSIHVHSHYSRFASFLENGVYDSANAHLLTLLLETDIKQDELKEVCKKVDQLLPQLTENESIILLHHLLTALQNYPLLLDERALILTRYGELFLQKELQFDHLVTVMHSFTTAQFPGESLFTPLLPFIYREFRIRLGKADPVSFGELLQTFYDRFGLNTEITKKLHEIAFEVYMEQVKSTNASQFSPYLFTITDGKEGRLPISNSPIPTTIYRERLREIRTANYTQYERASAFCDFFRMLIEDAIFILGEPPPACHYDIRASGSLARAEMCPYSDLEYFILINEERFRPYFEKLAQILHLQVLSLGETPPDKQEIFQFGQKSGLRIDPASNPALDGDLINTVDILFAFPSDMDDDQLKAFKSHLDTISLYRNHAFDLPHFDNREQALFLLEMRRKEFQDLKILQGAVCHLKYELIEPLFHFLGDLGLYFGLGGGNTIDLIDELPLFTPTSKRLLQRAARELYELRVQLHLASGEIQDEVLLKDVDVPLLKMIHQLVLIPLYTIDLETRDIDLITIALKDPNEENVALAASCIEIGDNHELYYQLLNEPHQIELQRVYLKNAPEGTRTLANLPNRAGYRLSREEEERNLRALLEQITTDDPISGVEIHTSLSKNKFLTDEAVGALLDDEKHIRKKYPDSLHNVSCFMDLHFKELPYQPLMEYAIHSLTHRIMGKATPTTTLARIKIVDLDLVYPVLISETIEGDPLDKLERFDSTHLTWLRLCEILTKPGDGRLSNYVGTKEGVVYCVDNDVSFMEPVVNNWLERKIYFTSFLFTLKVHLKREVLDRFCLLEPDLILHDWIEELLHQEERYLSLFSPEELDKFYHRDPDRRFTPSLLLPKGTIATLCMQFYHLQSVLKEHKFNNPLLLLRELLSLQDVEKNQVGIVVERSYEKAFSFPLLDRLARATAATLNQSMTSQKVMKINYKHIPSFQEVESRKLYSLQEASNELTIIETQKIWTQIFIVKNKETDNYTLELDLEEVKDVERERLLLHYILHLYLRKEQKPRSLTIRHAKALDSDFLSRLLHPDLRSLDLSYSAPFKLTPIEKKCPYLEELDLEGSPHLKQINLQLTHLQRLNVSYCPNLSSLKLTSLNIAELKINHCPSLVKIYLSQVEIIEIDWKQTPLLANKSFINLLYFWGTHASPSKKYYFLEKAASLGHKEAQKLLPHALFELGKSYADEKQGEKARVCWEEAATQYSKRARQVLYWIECLEIGTFVNLGHTIIGEVGATCLADALKTVDSVTLLELEGSYFGESGFFPFSRALMMNRSITNLSLTSCDLGDMEALLLADALAYHHSLTTINLRYNSIEDTGAVALARALNQNQSITTFDIRENRYISSEGYEAFFEVYRGNTTLTDLLLDVYPPFQELHKYPYERVIEYNPVYPGWVRTRGAALLSYDLRRNRTLKEITYVFQRIFDRGAACFASALKGNTTLTDLDLSGSSIGDQGTIKLANALLKNSTLLRLSLEGGDRDPDYQNSIGFSGAKAISSMLRANETLTHLSLSHTDIGEEGVISLAAALKENHALLHLDLASIKFGTDGIAALNEMLCVNRTLKHLDLKSCEIDSTGLAEGVKQNPIFSSFNLSGNQCTQPSLFQGLTRLNLSSTSLTPESMSEIGFFLKENTTLLSLNLSHNFPTTIEQTETWEEGCMTIADALYTNKTLLTLTMTRCNLEDLSIFAVALKVNHTLLKLNVSFNPSMNLMPFAEVLKENHTLVELDLSSFSGISDESANAIVDALRQNTTLLHLSMPEYTSGVTLREIARLTTRNRGISQTP